MVGGLASRGREPAGTKLAPAGCAVIEGSGSAGAAACGTGAWLVGGGDVGGESSRAADMRLALPAPAPAPASAADAAGCGGGARAGAGLAACAGAAIAAGAAAGGAVTAGLTATGCAAAAAWFAGGTRLGESSCSKPMEYSAGSPSSASSSRSNESSSAAAERPRPAPAPAPAPAPRPRVPAALVAAAAGLACTAALLLAAPPACRGPRPAPPPPHAGPLPLRRDLAAARLEAPPQRGPAPAEAAGVATAASSSDCAAGSISRSPSTSDTEMSESPKLMDIGFFKGLPGLKPPAAAVPGAPGAGGRRVVVGAAAASFLPAPADAGAVPPRATGSDGADLGCPRFLEVPSPFFPPDFFFGAALISMSSSSSSSMSANDGLGFFSGACGQHWGWATAVREFARFSAGALGRVRARTGAGGGPPRPLNSDAVGPKRLMLLTRRNPHHPSTARAARAVA